MIQNKTRKNIAKVGLAALITTALTLAPKQSSQQTLTPVQDTQAEHLINWENYYRPNQKDTTYNYNQSTLADQYFSQKNKLIYHTNTIKEFAEFYGKFEMKYSDTKKLLALGLAKADIESTIQQTNPDNTILTSPADAKGIYQFLPIALEDLNEKLTYLREKDSAYHAIKDFDIELAISPSPAGARENIRAGLFSLMNGLEAHQGDWQYHVARYNWGTGNLQDNGITHKNFHDSKDKLPAETTKYIKNWSAKSKTFGDNIDAYIEKNLNAYLINLYSANLKTVRNTTTNDSTKQEVLNNLLALNEIMLYEGKDENNSIRNNIARTHYYQAELFNEQGNEDDAKTHYTLAHQHSPEEFWINNTSQYRLAQLNHNKPRQKSTTLL